MRMTGLPSTSLVLLLAILSFSHTSVLVSAAASGLNGTVCILAPPEMAARIQQEVQRQVMEQLQLRRQQEELQQQLLLTPGVIPPAFRSNDVRYNVPLRPTTPGRSFFDGPPPLPSFNATTGGFWNRPPNRTTTSEPTTGYQADDPSSLQQRIPIDSPSVYDRSDFRREPLHPSFGSNNRSPGQRVPSLVTGQAVERTGPTNKSPDENQNNLQTTSPGPWSRFTTPSPRKEPAPQTSFFDPTRRPKTNRDQIQATTRKPFYNRDQNNGGKSSGRNPQTQTPQLTKEVTTRSPNQGSAAGGAADETKDPTQGVDVIPGPVEQVTPEYAYIKQPISSVLEQPDLELEGKPVKFGILKDALDRVGLLDLMSQNANPVTLFAPTDEAFLNLDRETLTRMQQNPSFLRTTMLRHIVNFEMSPDALKNNIVVPAYSGEPLIMNVVPGQKQMMLVSGTPIIAATNTLNGVIYVINKVMTVEITSATVAEELAIRPETSVFYQFISRSTQIRRLQGQGPFTILAPNNSAFEKLPIATRQALDFNPILLEKLLSFHIVEGAIFQKELESVPSIPSSTTGPKNRVEPIKLRATPDGSILVNEMAIVNTADIATGNGVIHVIDSVLMPPELASTFRKIEARSLAKAAAAAAREPTTRTSSLQRDEAPSVRPAFGFSAPRERSANFAVRSGTRRGNELSTSSTTRPDSSGIEREGPPKTPDGESSSRFYRWIKKSGFLEVLINAGKEYTVILPIDRAVNRLPLKYQQALETNSRQLESLLMYHIIPGSVNLTKLKDEDTIPTVSGKDIRFNRLSNDSSDSNTTSAETTTVPTTRSPSRDPNGLLKNDTTSVPKVTFSGAGLMGQANETKGKIVYLLVDRVMYPPQGNLFHVISSSPILKSLANLIKVSGLESGLSETGPFTLFAPSDQAFEKLPLESTEYLTHDSQSSRAFLLRHIIRPVLFTSAVAIDNETVIESTTGQRLQLVREKDVVKVDGVPIRYADITATNGVIHVIDHVL